jgi:hypothetical protein
MQRPMSNNGAEFVFIALDHTSCQPIAFCKLMNDVDQGCTFSSLKYKELLLGLVPNSEAKGKIAPLRVRRLCFNNF